MHPPGDLQGWKDIARHLGVSVRTAQEYERTLRLPIRRLPGQPRSRVRAAAGELDEWMSRTRGGLGQALSESGAAEPTVPHGSHNRRIWFVLAGLVLATIILVARLTGVVFRPGNPDHYLVDGKLLRMFDKANRELWSYSLPGIPLPPQYQRGSPYAEGRDLFVDLDGDGRNEFLYVYHPPQEGEFGHMIYCFSSGGKALWTFRPTKAITTASGRQLSGPYRINILASLTKRREDGGRVLVGSFHTYDWPYQLALLDSDGKVVSEYWHAGWLWKLLITDVDSDGSEDLVLGGVNDSFSGIPEQGRDYRATLVILDSRKMGGQGVVSGVGEYGFQGIPSADERAVLEFLGLAKTGGHWLYRILRLSAPAL